MPGEAKEKYLPASRENELRTGEVGSEALSDLSDSGGTLGEPGGVVVGRARTGEVGSEALFDSGGTLGKPRIEAASWAPKMEFWTRSGSGKRAATWTGSG